MRCSGRYRRPRHCPLESTGEYPDLSGGQRVRMVEFPIEAIAGRIPVFTGVAGFSVDDPASQAMAYARFGVDGMVVALDAYFPLSASSCFVHQGRLQEQGHSVANRIPTQRALSSGARAEIAAVFCTIL